MCLLRVFERLNIGVAWDEELSLKKHFSNTCEQGTLKKLNRSVGEMSLSESNIKNDVLASLCATF